MSRRVLVLWLCVWGFGVLVGQGAERVVVMPVAEGEGVTVSGDGVWRAEGRAGVVTTQRVAVVEKPEIGEASYAVVGEVRYEGVEGAGHLAMWNEFPERGRFFTKTVNRDGPLGELRGDADWRAFALPFHKGDEADPARLEIDLVLPGAGTVMIRNMELIPGARGLEAMHPGAWWTPVQNRFVHAGIGVTLGLLGGLFGVASARPGWHRTAVATAGVITGLGIIAAVAGCAALATGQPGYVHLPVWLVAVLGLILGLHGVRKANQFHTAHELRRMEAHDLANG